MVQIDDAGSGSLIGGTCIGLYWPKYDIYKYDFVPLECYLPENFKLKVSEICGPDSVPVFKELEIPKMKRYIFARDIYLTSFENI